MDNLHNLQIFSQNEKEEKNLIFEKEFLEIENFYFTQIKILREENNTKKLETDKELKQNFDEILKVLILIFIL